MLKMNIPRDEGDIQLFPGKSRQLLDLCCLNERKDETTSKTKETFGNGRVTPRFGSTNGHTLTTGVYSYFFHKASVVSHQISCIHPYDPSVSDDSK